LKFKINFFFFFLQNKIQRDEVKEKKLLIIIVTDGEPTDNRGTVSINSFKQCLMSRSPIDRIFVTIVACTDDDTSISYLNKWDKSIRNMNIFFLYFL
jgi:hypothetical protein